MWFRKRWWICLSHQVMNICATSPVSFIPMGPIRFSSSVISVMFGNFQGRYLFSSSASMPHPVMMGLGPRRCFLLGQRCWIPSASTSCCVFVSAMYRLISFVVHVFVFYVAVHKCFVYNVNSKVNIKTWVQCFYAC